MFVAVPSLANGIKTESEDINGSTDYFIKCPQCQKGYQTFQALKEHMESSHPDLPVIENGTTTTTTNKILTPTTAATSPPPTFTSNNIGGPLGCSQCTASFTSKDQLEKHELLHSPNAQAVRYHPLYNAALLLSSSFFFSLFQLILK